MNNNSVIITPNKSYPPMRNPSIWLNFNFLWITHVVDTKCHLCWIYLTFSRANETRSLQALPSPQLLLCLHHQTDEIYCMPWTHPWCCLCLSVDLVKLVCPAGCSLFAENLYFECSSLLRRPIPFIWVSFHVLGPRCTSFCTVQFYWWKLAA